uniref:Chromosome partitioning protein ParB n=1 Tax=uncultured Alphaproteobacteria bacterium TaxID=91750 RepID=A0A6M4NQB7_9PROT|nr:chromosome partitioning protein ParB [uncultured Alphaproteobacteria bacterium]
MLNDNNHKRKSLGRGLGALLGDDAFLLEGENVTQQKGNNGIQKISLNLLEASNYQPRLDFDEDALNALAASIKEKGVLQPLLVRAKENGIFEIIAGERRFRAAKLAGLSEVPVIIKEMGDKEVLEVALVENLLRENLSAIEEAEGLQRLIDEFSHTQEALSEIVGKSRSYIANTLRLLALPNSVQQMVRNNILTAGHVRPLIGLDNAAELAQKIVDKGLNVRQVEAMVQKSKTPTLAKSVRRPNADIADIEQNLNRRLGVKVKISAAKNGGGKIVINYSDLSELDKLIDILGQSNTVEKNKIA